MSHQQYTSHRRRLHSRTLRNTKLEKNWLIARLQALLPQILLPPPLVPRSPHVPPAPLPVFAERASRACAKGRPMRDGRSSGQPSGNSLDEADRTYSAFFSAIEESKSSSGWRDCSRRS